ncbi:MAG: efflux RND transporter periplasmic adaptor subunit [Alphaproteobacteria bacterium]|nr:efflux RND transporter periplasmic adaptor subunit [Alphaproteobacteria bacterium SS10]
MFSIWPSPIRAALFLALPLVALTACEDQAQQQAGGAPPPPTVTVAEPLVRDVIEEAEYTGRFEAVEFVELRARVSGYLDSINFQPGDVVQAGDLLFVIDQRPFQLDVDRAEADLSQERTALRLAIRERERAEQLVANRNISESVFDERVQTEQASRARIQASQAALRQAQLNLEFTEIRAPVSGRISREQVTVGNLISGGTANATLLTTISSVDPIYFFFDVNEADYLRFARVAANQGDAERTRVTLALADETEFINQGEVDFVEPRFDFETSTVTLRAVLDNPNGTFIPGLFAKVRVPATDEFEAILVPDDVVGTDQTTRFVYVIGEGDVAEARPVITGPLIEGFRVIEEGLRPGERIVINGLQRVRPGAPVTPEPGEIRDVFAESRP